MMNKNIKQQFLSLKMFTNRVFQVVQRDLMHAIRKKRPAMAEDTENIIYHYDNAPAHSASQTNLELSLLGFHRLLHSPYSPDLAPLDFAYFPTLKSNLRGTRFTGLDDIRSEVTSLWNVKDATLIRSDSRL